MTKHFKLLLCTAVATAFAFATPACVLAQSTSSDKAEKSEKSAGKSAAKSESKSEAKSDDKAKEKKPLTAQQQKMKDCGAKWQDEKKAKGVSGKTAYQKFLSTCLKA